MNTEDKYINKIKKGLFNEAFRDASNEFEFCLGNPKFIAIIFNTLQEIGFFNEAKSLEKFLADLTDYRENNNHASSKNKLQNGSLDFSNEYNKLGKLDLLTNPLWIQRAKIIASLIPQHARVMDFGCGNMLLEEQLHSSIHYIPCDINKRDERTIVCDFDNQDYPPTMGETIITCIGVINYLSKQKELIEHICSRVNFFIITIKPHEYITKKIESNVFNPSLHLEETINIIERQGFSTEHRFILGKGDEVMIIAKK